MRRKRTIALALQLEWGFRRHVDVFDGVQQYAATRDDWQCVIDEYAQDRLSRKRGARPRYDGIIARASRELAESAEKAGVPTVNVWFNSPAAAKLPGVFPDFAASGRLAAEHLLSRGFRRFACLRARGERADVIVRRAFHETLSQAGCACQCAEVPSQYFHNRVQWQAFRRTTDAWMGSWTPPIGVFVMFNDVTTRHVAESCRHHGLAIPEQVGLIGGLNETSICLAPEPALSGIEVRYDRVGYEAARMLDRLMSRRGKPKLDRPLLVPPAGVVARQSTDFFAVSDELVGAALRFIAERGAAALAVEDVARHVHVGRRTLERRFQASLGRPIAAEMRRLRLEKARRELSESDLPIKAVAERCGFSDSKRLHEAFRREAGLSPSAFRRQARRVD